MGKVHDERDCGWTEISCGDGGKNETKGEQGEREGVVKQQQEMVQNTATETQHN